MEKDKIQIDKCDVICLLYDSKENKRYLKTEIIPMLPEEIPRMLIQTKVEARDINKVRQISVANSRPDAIYREIVGFGIEPIKGLSPETVVSLREKSKGMSSSVKSAVMWTMGSAAVAASAWMAIKIFKLR